MAKKRRRSAKENQDEPVSAKEVENEEDDPDSVDKDEIEDEAEAENDGKIVADAEKVDEEDEEIIPFLDSFYGLSSSDPQERSVSAQAMLFHCLLGPQANTKDAAYAMKRLLNGLCSSRDASRQGYAAALASFLKLTFSLGTMKDIQSEAQEEGSLLNFFRERLCKATDSSQVPAGSKKKASEERDYHLGRLFGILSVIRSGTLLPTGKDEKELSEFVENAVAYVGHLVELYLVKSTKEAAANAIVTFLDVFYKQKDIDGCKVVVDDVVRSVLIPKFLITGVPKNKDKQPLSLEAYTAEQLAVMINIQSNAAFHPKKLPSPLEKPILSLKTIPAIAPVFGAAGKETKLHQVWISTLSFLTESVVEEPKSEKKRKGGPTRRILKKNVGADAAQDILDAILEASIFKPLAAAGSKDSDNNPKEQRALVFSLVRILCGGQYFDSTSGPSFIDLDPKVIEEKILRPDVVNMLVDVLTVSGGKSAQKQVSQELKPLAMFVLESLVDRAEESDSESNSSRRLAFARALLRCEPRFDARTEVSVTSELLVLGSNPTSLRSVSGSLIQVWTDYISFLLQQTISNALEETKRSATDSASELDSGFSHKALGYIDLLFGVGKHVLRLQTGSNSDESAAVDAFRTSTIRRLLSFFMVAAFFKLSSLKTLDVLNDNTKKSKKKKSKSRASLGADQPAAVEFALLLKESMTEIDFIPLSIRKILSSRFFSLLAEHITFSPSNSSNKDHKSTKDERAWTALSQVLDGWQALEQMGAVRYESPGKPDDGNNEDQEDPLTMVSKLRSMAEKSEGLDPVQLRWNRSASVLAMTVYLHLLHYGSRVTPADDADEEVDAEDDDEVEGEEIIEFICDLKRTSDELLSPTSQSEENPLMGLAELCVGILTSPLGNGTSNRGASSKLVREIVKLHWTAGLSLCANGAASCQRSLLDHEVVALLLDSMGASSGGDMDLDQGENDDDEHDDDENDDDDDSEDKAPKRKSASKVMDTDEDEDDADGGDSDDEDIVLDPSKLPSLLMEESDDDMEVELEHHQGADAALGRLIRAKKEARKAGQQARERVEMSNNLRNSALLEVCVSNPGKAWNSLLRSDVILGALLPLLGYRNDLEKSLAKSAEKGKNSSDAEKKALVERIAVLLKSKLCKMRLAASSIPFSEGVNPTEFVSGLLGQLVKEAAKSQSRDQLSCCSSAWIVSLRSLSDPLQAIQATQPHCQEAVRIWANQRNSGIATSLLEDLIQQAPSVAKASLAGPLAQVAKTSRNFLKAEAFRLLSLLYGIPSSPTTTTTGEVKDSKSVGTTQLEESTGDVVEAILASLEDPDLIKAKRRRDVLKTLEKLVTWVSKELNPCSAQLASKLRPVADRLDDTVATTETPATKQQNERLVQEIRAICSKAVTAKPSPKSSEKGSGKKNKKNKESRSPKDEGSSTKKKSKKDKKK